VAVSGTIYQDSRYLTANPDWHEADAPWKAAQILRLLDRNKPRPDRIAPDRIAPDRIADVGCGTGAILDRVTEVLGGTGDGYEIAPAAFARAERRARDGLRFHLRDLLATDAVYDLVLAIDVFEHVDDYIGFLRALRRHARRHVFHIPLDMNAQNVMRRGPILKTRREVGHLHYFMKDTALATLEYAGYRIDDWVYTVHAEAAPRSGPLWRLARLPRALGLRISPDLSVRLLGGVSLLVLCHPEAGPGQTPAGGTAGGAA
jgi:SAM-dependent methyltransferase